MWVSLSHAGKAGKIKRTSLHVPFVAAISTLELSTGLDDCVLDAIPAKKCDGNTIF